MLFIISPVDMLITYKNCSWFLFLFINKSNKHFY